MEELIRIAFPVRESLAWFQFETILSILSNTEEKWETKSYLGEIKMPR